LANCLNCVAWFHYEDGSPDGLWVVGLTGPCDDMRENHGTGVTYFGFPFEPNPKAQQIWIGYNMFNTPVPLEALADALYYEQQTKLSTDGQSADDYKVVCADVVPTGAPCPPGYYFDGATETCMPLSGVIRIPVVTPVPPPPSPLPPPENPPPEIPPILPQPGQPDPEGDEITQTLCAQMAANTAILVSYLQQLVQQQQGGAISTGSCCAEVVAAIAGVTSTLTAILNVLPSLAAPGEAPLDPVTCSQLTALFGQLVTAWNTGNQAIVTAIAGIPGLDPCVCKELTRLNDGDPALLAMVESLIKQMNADGTISSDLAQIALSGSPTPV
jgi:hypothetical protein